ncbi:MAG: hypothetical protein CL472_01270 [Acidobacteria bacterium]|nr:hypothetical protein [Acidobacteriota bacterium]
MNDQDEASREHIDRASMTQDDIIARDEPEVPASQEIDDISHDHAMFRLVEQANSVRSNVEDNSPFLEDAVKRFDEIIADAHQNDVSLALVSNDITSKWKETQDNEGLKDDLEFLMKQAPQKYRNPLQYEGLDMSDHDLQWRKSMDGVGEKVRLKNDLIEAPGSKDSDNNIAPESFASRELTISKAIVRGQEASDGFGGTRTAAYLEYEFEGEPGRYNANQFIEAEGRDHAFGVMMVKDNRLWMAPIDVEDFDNPKLDGPAREIVGYAGKSILDQDPDGIDGVKKEILSEGPNAGEYYYRPRDGFDAPGPIELYSSPWQSGADEKQILVAKNAINDAIAQEGKAPERILSKGPAEAEAPTPDRGIER